jgi:putative membrane-bound dehydrogenase-like protein
VKPLPFLGLALAGTLSAATEKIGPHSFTLPDGFQIRQVASTNDVLRPVNGTVDNLGRLYVTDSSGSTEPPAEQAKDPRWRIVRLEDSDGDGVYDRSVVFADRLPILQGILWHGGAVYMGGTPAIWKLTDTDGDGRSDTRTEWWNVGHPSTHCGNEVHGPYAGPDGFLYWTKGAFEPVRWTNGVTGKVERDRASHIFRALPDGSRMESVMTGGMDNPVGVAFNADGELFFTSTFIDFSQPGWRDGVGHATYGAVFGKDNSVLNDRAVFRAGPGLAHPFVQMGAAAPSGLTAYSHSALGAGFQGNLFASSFNLRKISRLELSRSGASFTAKDSDFVVSDNLDFHPTDVLTDIDGSLLILDTGGWYKLCCPSSQLWKADVLGGVFRVKRGGVTRPRRMEPVIGASESDLGRLRRSGNARDPRGTGPALDHLGAAIRAGDPFGQRVAITALGQARIRTAVPRILEALAAGTDPVLHAAGIQALAEIGDAEALRVALVHPALPVRIAALVALDQVTERGLEAREILPLLFSPDASMRTTANWVVSRHGDWAESIASGLRQRLGDTKSGPVDADSIAALLAGVIDTANGRQLASDLAASEVSDVTIRRAALEAMASARPKTPPADWIAAVTTALTSDADAARSLRGSAVRTARSLGGSGSFSAGLLSVARDTGNPRTLRIEAYAALPTSWKPSAADLSFLLSAVTGRESGAAEALAHSDLSPDQVTPVLGLLKEIGPLELTRLLPAFERTTDPATGSSFVRALSTAKARAAVRPDLLRTVLKSHAEPVKAEGERLLETLQSGLAEQRKHLAEIRGKLPEGDIRRGQAVFNSSKAACIQCHHLGYQGGDVGPDLTAIGTVRSADDLLEAILYPSASFVRSYEPVTVATKEGEEHLGVLRRDDERGVTLVTGPNASLEIRREDIAEVRPSSLSLMPAGLEEQLSLRDLSDLLAFLKNTKWGKN